MNWKDFLGSIFRHTITTGGGYMAASGIATEEQSAAITGGVVALIGLLLSWLDKKKEK